MKPFSLNRAKTRLLGAAGASALLLTAFGAAPSAPDTRTPTPASVLGFEPCADYKVATYEELAAYFHALALSSRNRMRLVDIGRTVEGRTQLMAIVTSEKNMRQLDTFKGLSRMLALARDDDRPLDDDQARDLARRGKAVVWIDFGLHSSEVASAQTAPLVAYQAVTDESDEMRAIRDNVIFLLVPSMNPDGTTMVAEWYRQHLGKAWENRLPELWHRYVGHDDNRDWYMMTQPETRNSARQLYGEWFPQIVYNQHQAAPFPSRIFVPPFDDPMNPNIPPLVMRGVNLVGDVMTRRLDREGKRGAISRLGFDTWWNGGMRTAPYFHNMVGILTETAHPTATPAKNDPASFPRTFSNGVPTLTPSTYYPSPYLGGEWRMRQSCDYMVTTSMAVLDVAAKRREEWLYDVYRMGRDAVRANVNETFLIPADQWDPGTAVKLVNTLRLGGVDVERATAPFTVAGTEYGTGTFVIRGAQPFEPYIKDLLTPQVYPDLRLSPGSPPRQPYDITGWTLSYQMGVKVDRVMVPVAARTERVNKAPVPAGSMPGMVGGLLYPFAIDPRANDAFIAVNRLLKAGDTVSRTETPIAVGRSQWPAGTFLVAQSAGTDGRVFALVRELGLTVGVGPTGPVAASVMKAPRVAVYHGWGGNIDEGWTRWVLEQFEFPYTQLHDAEVRTGGLIDRYDVIVLPDATYRQMMDGFGSGAMPDQYTGGMTARGVANLKEFTERGGTLIAMNRAAELPLTAFGLPVRNILTGLPDTEFYVPGAILRLTVDPSHPVAYGMPRDAAAFFVNSPAFTLDASASNRAGTDRPQVVAGYPANNLLLSGWVLGDRSLAGQAAVVDVPSGRGRIVLLGFRAQHRGQPHGTFKLLFNSLYLSRLDRRSAAQVR